MSLDQKALHARFAFAQALIKEAGDLALSYFNKRSTLTVKSKGMQDVVSEADLQTELLIKKNLAESFPEDGFLGEETGATDYAPGQGIWVVDPIDGTQPFISGMSSWCVSIGFVLDGQVIFGLVYAPARNELFAGGAGEPGTLNGQKLTPNKDAVLNHGIVAIGHSPRVAPEVFLKGFSGAIKAGAMFYRDGSGALALCYVAAGRLTGYAEAHINSWDCAGAIGVLQATGLNVSPFLAGEGLRKGNKLIAGPDQVYAALTDLFN